MANTLAGAISLNELFDLMFDHAMKLADEKFVEMLRKEYGEHVDQEWAANFIVIGGAAKLNAGMSMKPMNTG